MVVQQVLQDDTCTSRPSVRNHTQQQQAVEQRLGCKRAAALRPYLEDVVPLDPDSGERLTANPLLLSMVVSIFEIREGLQLAGVQRIPQQLRSSVRQVQQQWR